MQLFVGAKGLIHHQGKILLVRESPQYQDGSEEGKWDVPGGRIEGDEELHVGLKREIEEESGLHIIPKKLLGAFDGFPVIRGEKCHVVRLYFFCEAIKDDVVLSSDHDMYDWVDPHNIEDKQLMDDIEEMLKAVQEYI